MPNRIWVDVEDLFQYAALNARPSGIQRIEFELCRSLALMPETRDRVGFLRHVPGQHGFQAIPFAEIDALHERLTAAETAAPVHAGTSPAAATAGAGTSWPAALGGRGLARRIAYRLPSDLRLPLTRLLRSQREGLDAVGLLGRAAAGHLGGLGRRAVPAGGGGAADGLTVAAFVGSAAAGDVLLVLGSTWFHPFYGELVAMARERWGMRIAVLIYDIIPLLRPEWCDQNLTARFRHWALGLLPQADILLTISQASARDLGRFAARAGIALRASPQPIPVGTGFSGSVASGSVGGGVPPPSAARGARLPAAGSYVLTVSTIEARKNHALLLRVWRRLLDEMPAAAVPTLVFAGRVGWLVDDLMRQLRNADWLDGRIVLIADPRDDELAQLYAGCRFTVFPSFYEGWGLPVTESLGFGRPCIASNASALPEAGGTLARYFDPEDGLGAARVIRHAIEDADGTEAWRARVAAEFRPVGWDESARGMLRALDQGRPRAAPPGLALPPARASHLV